MQKKYLSLFSIFILYTYSIAQVAPPSPPASAAAGGIVTPGIQATPIDSYTIYLVLVAVMITLVYYTTNKYKKALI